MTTELVLCWPPESILKDVRWRDIPVHRHCVRIPLIYIVERPPIGPVPPDQGPLNDQWVSGLSREAQQRLQILATVHALVQHLDTGARERFEKLTMDSIGSLPDDMELHARRIEAPTGG